MLPSSLISICTADGATFAPRTSTRADPSSMTCQAARWTPGSLDVTRGRVAEGLRTKGVTRVGRSRARAEKDASIEGVVGAIQGVKPASEGSICALSARSRDADTLAAVDQAEDRAQHDLWTRRTYSASHQSDRREGETRGRTPSSRLLEPVGFLAEGLRDSPERQGALSPEVRSIGDVGVDAVRDVLDGRFEAVVLIHAASAA